MAVYVARFNIIYELGKYFIGFGDFELDKLRIGFFEFGEKNNFENKEFFQFK